MAYRAYIVEVRDNPVPTDSIFVTVRFEDAATNRSITKEFKYVAGSSCAAA